MADRYLFVTGKLAAPALRETLRRAELPFDYEVAVMKITVAALMTPDWIAKRLEVPEGVTRIMIPGLCEGDPEVLGEQFGIPAEKGPARPQAAAGVLRAGRRPLALRRARHPRVRRDQQRPAPRPRADRRGGELLPRCRRRRHRPRALAGPQMARRGARRDRRPQGPRLHAQHRHARPRRDPDGRRGRRGLRPQPQRAQPPCRGAAARDAGADPGHARRPRQPRRDHRPPRRRSASRSSSTRSSSRSARASRRASAATWRRAAATPTSRCSWGSAT